MPPARDAPLVTDTPLSFWGGVDPASGRVVDRHHPLHGVSLAGRALVMPTSRGSSSGSAVLLELLARGRAPAAVLHTEAEDVVTLGTIVAEELFELSMPVRRIGRDVFDALLREDDNGVEGSPPSASTSPAWASLVTDAAPFEPATSSVALSVSDRAMLDGAHGEAARVAMRIMLRMAAIQGATRLLDVTRVHVDGCLAARASISSASATRTSRSASARRSPRSARGAAGTPIPPSS